VRAFFLLPSSHPTFVRFERVYAAPLDVDRLALAVADVDSPHPFPLPLWSSMLTPSPPQSA
jgi:hypothetical protein